jgi:hypothetical protein
MAVRPLTPLHTLLDEARAGRNVDLAPNDGLDASPTAHLIELDRTVKHTVIGERHGIMPAFLDTVGEITKAACAVQQAVFTVQMQMNEISHTSVPFYIK